MKYHNGIREEKIKLHILIQCDLQAEGLWATQFSNNGIIEERNIIHIHIWCHLLSEIL